VSLRVFDSPPGDAAQFSFPFPLLLRRVFFFFFRIFSESLFTPLFPGIAIRDCLEIFVQKVLDQPGAFPIFMAPISHYYPKFLSFFHLFFSTRL